MLTKKGFSIVEVLVCFTFIMTLLITIYTQVIKYRLRVKNDYIELVMVRNLFNIWEIFESDYEYFEENIKKYYECPRDDQIVVPISFQNQNPILITFQYRVTETVESTIYELKLLFPEITGVSDLLNYYDGYYYRKAVVYHE